MSIHVHELKELKMYRDSNKLILPLDDKDNKHNSLIYLLTPNIQSSINMINSNMTINRNWFRSYYIDKSVNAIISPDNTIKEFVEYTDDFVDMNIMLEDKLNSKERNSIDNKDFGIPSKRKFPLNDEEHVRAAIRMFNHVDKEDEEILAKNIIKKLKKFNITDIEVGENNRFSKYYRTLKEYKYNPGNIMGKKIELSSYDYYWFDNSKDIEREYKECKEMYIRDGGLENLKSLNVLIYSNVKYLGKAYDNDRLVGFCIGVKAPKHIIELGIYIDGEYYRKEEEREELGTFLMNNFRDYSLNYQKDTKYKIAKVYSLNGDIKLIKNLRISCIKDGSLIDNIYTLKFLNFNMSKTYIIINIGTDDIKFDTEDIKMSAPVSENTLNPEGIRSGDKAFIFGEIFNEDYTNSRLREYLYNERIKTQKDLMNVYKIVKQECPVINYTKVDYKSYKNLNLFFDVSYYHRLFLEKNNLVGSRGVNLYTETLARLLNNKNVESNYTKKTIFIPISDYVTKDVDIFDYNKNINPISVITRHIRTSKFDKLKYIFKDTDIIFFGKKNYFKVNFSKFDRTMCNRFISNINNILNNSVPVDTDDMIKDTPDAIVTDIVDKLERSQKIKLYGFTGETKKDKNVPVASDTNSDKLISDKEADKKSTEAKKEIVVEKIKRAANSSTSTEEAIDKLDEDEYLSNLIQDISNEESDNIKVSATRKARINKLSGDLKDKSIKGKSVKDLIYNSYYVGDKEPLPTTSVNINSINNDQWDNLQYINFNKEYDVDEDIMAILDFFATRTVPVAMRDVKVEDTSTSEDLVETWTCQCEDINGTRFQLVFDVPKFKNNRLMRLRGNDKTINAQLMNLPILKTEYDTAQITTNYNKIFFYVFGSAAGKSNVVAGKIIKALGKYTGNSITYRIGNNTLTAMKYEVPIDYSDLGKNYSYIKYKNCSFYFDQDEIREKYKDIIDLDKGLPIGYNETSKSIIYSDGQTFCSQEIASILCEDKEFDTLFKEAKPSVKYAYSQASILNTRIPVIVICAYCEGLIKTLNKAKISFSITDKRPQYSPLDEDVIRFKDGYLLYKLDYNSSMLLNGLKECDTANYSIKDINNKTMWIESLDNFGGRIKSDGIDNFYDLMFDPMSIRTCEAYNLPSDFVEGIVYASDLLSDTKYNKHIDVTGNRFRSNEIVAGYVYKVLSKSYADYKTKLKKTGKATMTVKRSAVIDEILKDSTTSDMSTINDLCYAEANNTVSYKGLSGLNSDRSYSLDKRAYDTSMNGLIAMSTGFAGTVGVTRQTTTNMNIQGKRGYIKDTSTIGPDQMNDVNTMSIAENLTPMSTTHDDPFREAMSFIQRTKHDMRVAGGDPLLLTNGMDDALPQFTPDYFSFNAKKDGKIIERDEEHITIQYKDGTYDYVDLTNKVYKNSDGGFYASIKLKPSDKLGTTVKAGQTIAYDPLSYTQNIGYDDNPTYNQGTIVKIAAVNTDKGFEDSCVVNSYISNALSSDVITQKDVVLPKTTNVFNLVKVGDKIQEGEPLLVIQNTFEDNDVNVLLKNLVDDEETVTSLGRIPIKSHNTGVIEDIKIYRTCELDEMSPSLKKIVTDYEKNKSRIANNIAKYDKAKAKEYVNNYKLSQTGKLKNVEDGVLIEIYVNYKDDFGIGDKLIILGAQKGVAKNVYEKGHEPRSSYRPDEPIDCIMSMRSFDARMITAPILYILAYKGLIELDRQVKDIMGVKQDYTIHHTDLE